MCYFECCSLAGITRRASDLCDEESASRERAYKWQQLARHFALPRDPTLRSLALTIDARQTRYEQTSKYDPPRGSIWADFGIDQRCLRLRLDGLGYPTGTIELFKSNAVSSSVFAHQPFQHEGQQRERVLFSLDFGLQALND